MNILFLTLASINSIEERGIYTDLLRKFRDMGHSVSVVTPVERRLGVNTNLKEVEGVRLLQVRTLNIQKTNLVEKGLGTLAIEYQYLAAIKKYLSDTRFDLVLYSTPPITFGKVIAWIKKRDGATSYLLLKDIFPQNAVDLGMMKKNGLLHLFFRNKERKLYSVSDYIGCMSPANVDYVLKHNPEIDARKVEVCPNSIEPLASGKIKKNSKKLKRQYGIPENAILFIYGGNLGKPQGIDFLLRVLASIKERKDIFFVVVGSGTAFAKVKTWFNENNPNNSILLPGLPKSEYDNLIQSCDVGLIFLDHRFTIPNFPSRLLSYMEYKMPVIAATDVNTDIGKIIETNGFGYWAESGDLAKMIQHIESLATNKNKIQTMGTTGYNYLIENYTVSHSYQKIISHFND